MYNVKERAIGRKDVACTSEPGFTGVEKVKGGLLDVLAKKQKTKPNLRHNGMSHILFLMFRILSIEKKQLIKHLRLFICHDAKLVM